MAETVEQETMSPSIRRSLEDFWRRRLNVAQSRYDIAKANYTRVLGEPKDNLSPEPGSALARARRMESDALAEYARVVNIFTEVTLHGRVPIDQTER